MIWVPFKVISKRYLGVDIGTSSIKIVELSSKGDRIKLENYGEMSALTVYEKPFRTSEKSTLLLSNYDIAKAIRAICEESKIKEKKTVFSIPDFSTFFTDFKTPPMTQEELAEAVKYQARQYIPMPLSEVILDWSIIEGKIGDQNQKSTPLKILLVAVPMEVINQYQEIAALANLKLQAIEAEVFGVLRALAKESQEAICLVDVGAQSTSLNIVEKGILRKSHSFDVSGNELTQLISKSLNISYKEAEDLKKEKGLNLLEPNIRRILLPLIDFIIAEIEKLFRIFYQAEGREVRKIILTGGSAQLPGLKEYFAEELKVEVEIANPFSNIFYPPILEETIKKIGPSYTIAVGMALRGLEL